MTDRDTYAEIAEALRFYLDGLYESDVEKMRRVFHPCCHLYSAPDGVLDDSDLESYLARVASRESPRALKQKRHDAILSVDCAAEGAAFARLRTARAPRLYTDYLSLLKIDGRWQIVAKTFGWVPLPD